MTLEELEKKLTELDDLRAELNAVIAELKGQNEEKPTPPHQRWKPNEDEMYYSIRSDGMPYRWSWHDSCDNGTSTNRYRIGNVFRTKAEAEFAAERLKVIAEMREWAGKWDDDFVIAYSGENNEIGVFELPSPHVTYGIMRFASRNDAINCIKAVGEDRIKKYYFMITEV